MSVDPNLVWAVATSIVGASIGIGAFRAKTTEKATFLDHQVTALTQQVATQTASIMAKIEYLQCNTQAWTQQIGERVKGVEVRQESLEETADELKSLVKTVLRAS